MTATQLKLPKWLGYACPHTRTSLRQAFASDRLLLWTTVALALLAWVPLFLTPFLPFSDLGINTACADLIWDTAAGRQPAATFYQVQWGPLPYWTTYGLSALLGKVFGPLVAAKLLTGFIFILVPLSIMRLLLALGRDARLGLWAFALTWEHNLYAGWMALLFGVGVASFLIAWMLEAETVGDGFRLAPYAALLGLTHAQATMLFGIAATAFTFTSGPVRKRIAIHAAVFVGTALVVVPWLLGQLLPNGTAVAGAPRAHFGFEWHPLAYKLSQFFAYTLGNFSRPDAEWVAGATLIILVFGPLLLTLLPSQPVRHRVTPLILFVVAGAMYVFLPWAISGPIWHWYTYPRYSTVLLLWALLIPLPRLRGRLGVAALVPGVLAAVLMDVKAIEQFSSFGERTRPFLQVIAQVPPKAKVLAIVLDDNDPDPDLKLPPYHQFYAYITATGHGYSPYLWGAGSIPLINRPGTALPAPGWEGQFSMDAHGRFYDYILVQGFAHGDPLTTAVGSDGLRPRLQFEIGRWRLYSIH